jgi:hypothetical protein
MSTPMSFAVLHHRSTRAEILARDVDVQRLVDELKKAQQRNWTILADCIERCRASSMERATWRASTEAVSGTTGRYRCKTLACSACGTGMWRRAIRTIFERFHDADFEHLSVVTITGSSAPDMEAVRTSVRKLRRTLRDLRDAQAEKRASWREVQFAGLVDVIPARDDGPLLVQPVVRLLVHHPHVPWSGVERAMRDWFAGSGSEVEVSRYGPGAFVGSPPGTGLPMPWRAAVVGRLFEWHRGTEPLRVAVGPQGCDRLGHDRKAQVQRYVAPMPVLICR